MNCVDEILVDMALSPELARWLRGEGHDAMHAAELSMHRSSDAEILAIAARGGRVVIAAESESLDCIRRVFMAVGIDDLPV